MELIKWKIESLQKELERLKEQNKQSFNSVKEHWGSRYHNSLEDKCEMIYMLAQGLEYKPHSFTKDLKFTRGQVWKTNDYLDFCYIYEGFGEPKGFISLKSGLFDATQNKHKEMWLWAIKNEKEEGSFENFAKKLKKDTDFLINTFNETIEEKETRVYLVLFEDKKLMTGKFYIYLKKEIY